MPTPPFFGLTQLLTLLKQIQLDPSQMDQIEQRRDELQPDDLRTAYLGATGWGPNPGERLSQFWERSTPGVFPPNWTEPRGQDLQLPPEAGTKTKKGTSKQAAGSQPTNAELKQLIQDLFGQAEFFNNPKGR